MDQTILLVARTLPFLQPFFHRFDETLIQSGLRHWLIPFCHRHILWLQWLAQHLLSKGDETGQIATGERVAATAHSYQTRPDELKTGIGITPFVRVALALGRVVIGVQIFEACTALFF